MKKYSSYNDSGVEWIGEIPSHWDVIKIKFNTVLFNGDSLSQKKKEKFTSENPHHVPYVSTKHIDRDFGTIDYDNGLRIPPENEKYKVGEKGGFLLCIEGGNSGKKMGFLDRDVCFVNKLCYFKSDENSKFLFYYVKSNPFKYEFKLSTTGLIGGVSVTELGNFKVPSPPLPEQKKIVSFLDDRTSKIDRLIQSKQRKIELLKEKRTSLINEVVTKGLNTDVEMKDSGVEWIGEIPRHWVESKFGYYIRLRHGHQFRDNDFTDTGIKIIKITQLNKNGYLDLSSCSTIDPDRLDKFQDIRIYQGDILMCLTGGTIGKIIRVGDVDEPLLQNYRVGHFSPVDTDRCNNEYVFYLMSSQVIQKQILFDVRETGQPNIGMEDMNNMRIPIPPLNEQKVIVDYLDSETQIVDKTVRLENEKIDLLKEYKQSLISEVVTGKINVQEEVDEVLV